VPSGLPYIFKASYDKANRSSGRSPRGPGIDAGLQILAEVRRQIGVPVLTDVHRERTSPPSLASLMCCRRRPSSAGRPISSRPSAPAGKPVNIKKGQFLAPGDMRNVVAKARDAAAGADTIMVCERGVSFGYNNLVADMRSLAIMRESACPVVFDATHSVQLPGGQGTVSGGQREFVPVLARAAVAVGIAGLFMETHPRPERRSPTGRTVGRWHRMESLLTTLVALDRLVKAAGLEELR
jgi:2-dehydro-3-deoxyphosphooctonate aldolase (KDO 8-P synthase)